MIQIASQHVLSMRMHIPPLTPPTSLSQYIILLGECWYRWHSITQSTHTLPPHQYPLSPCHTYVFLRWMLIPVTRHYTALLRPVMTLPCSVCWKRSHPPFDSYQPTLSTHPVNPPYQYTLSVIHPINTLFHTPSDILSSPCYTMISIGSVRQRQCLGLVQRDPSPSRRRQRSFEGRPAVEGIRSHHGCFQRG